MIGSDGKVILRGEKLETEYLGDGAYVAFSGYDVAVFTSDGLSIQNVVYLDGNCLAALKRFVEAKTGKEFPS